MERDNGLFTPTPADRFRQAATGVDLCADLKQCITTELTEVMKFFVWGGCISKHINHQSST